MFVPLRSVYFLGLVSVVLLLPFHLFTPLLCSLLLEWVQSVLKHGTNGYILVVRNLSQSYSICIAKKKKLTRICGSFFLAVLLLLQEL